MTYRCQVACPHCIVQAGPHRIEKLELEDAFDWIGQIAAYQGGHIRSVALTGGEPFVDPVRLDALSRFADSHGLITSAVTNAFWATSVEKAAETLRKLPALRLVAVSCDAYHQAQIPFERVRNAVLALEELGLQYRVNLCTPDDADEEYGRLREKLLEFTTEDHLSTAVVFPVGRAKDGLDLAGYETDPLPPVSACSAAHAPIIFPDGRIVACIGPVIDLKGSHGLLLGDLSKETLAEALDRAELNPLLHAIRVWGPQEVVERLQNAGHGDLLPREYVKKSVCCTCYAMMEDRGLDGAIAELIGNEDFQKEIAYARAYYLKETRMAELLGLAEDPAP